MSDFVEDKEQSNGAAADPARQTDEEIADRLSEVQVRTRAIMEEFNIASANFLAMARQAEHTISDTSVLAEFLRLLIELHEYGTEAKRRGQLRAATKGTGDETSGEEDAEPGPEEAPPPTREATRAFFEALDEPEGQETGGAKP